MRADMLQRRSISHLDTARDRALRIVAVWRVQDAIDNNTTVQMDDRTIFAAITL